MSYYFSSSHLPPSKGASGCTKRRVRRTILEVVVFISAMGAWALAIESYTRITDQDPFLKYDKKYSSFMLKTETIVHNHITQLNKSSSKF